MRTLTADNDGIEIASQRFGSTDDPLLLIMGIGADTLYWHEWRGGSNPRPTDYESVGLAR